MEKKYIFSGGLDIDSSEAFIKDGDYVDAENISIETSDDGNRGSVKKIRAYDFFAGDWIQDFIDNFAFGIGFDRETVISRGLVEDESNGDVYCLFTCESTGYNPSKNYTNLVKMTSLGVLSALFSFQEEVLDFSDDEVNLKKVGDILVWRSSLGVWSWYIDRAYVAGGFANESMSLIKATPGHTIAEFIATGSRLLPQEDYQFTQRHVYDSGEISVIGSISPVISRQEVAGHIVIEAATFTPRPSGASVLLDDIIPLYLDKILFYVRVGNNGTWFKIGEKTKAEVESGTASTRQVIFNGTFGSALSDRDAALGFDSVPIRASSLEIVDSRVVLANINSFYEEKPIISIEVETSATNISDHTGKYLMNRGSYIYGVCLFDKYGRTLGVSATKIYRLSENLTVVPPAIKITFTSIPSWARYYSLVRTKNLEYSHFQAFHYDDYFFIFEDSNGDIKYTYVPDPNTERPKVKFLAVDISSSINKGHFYSFQDGDVFRFGDVLANQTDEVEYRVIANDGSLILLEPKFDNIRGTGAYEGNGICRIFSPSTSNQAEKIFYEQGPRLLTPQDVSETERYIFNEYEQTNLGSQPSGFTADATSLELDIESYGDYYNIPVFDNMIDWVIYQNDYTRIDGSNNLATGVAIQNRLLDPNGVSYIPYPASFLIKKPIFEINTDEGKPYLQVSDDNSVEFPSQLRFGGRNVSGLTINKISNFFPLDQKEMPSENGSIRAIKLSNKQTEFGAVLLVITEKETSSVYISESELQQTSGSPILSRTDLVLGNDNTLKGGFGTIYPGSVFAYEGNVWFWDDKKKKVVRYSQNGLEPISDSGTRSLFLSKSGDARIWHDPFINHTFIAFVNEEKAIGFDEKRGRWTTKLESTPPERVITYNEGNILSYRGLLYANNKSGYATYFGPTTGNPYDAAIESKDMFIEFIVKDKALPLLLERISIFFQEGFLDNDLNVKTGLLRVDVINENGQVTSLTDQNFLLGEKVIYSHFFRDENSAGGLIDGDFMIGSFHRVKITILDKTIAGIMDVIGIGYSITQGHSVN
jgi:hypothetical protein